ncbi:hypothetical protein [Actinomadura logoneensis]|uniref:hypothetical protein n=1 Tax=Actinomadura logoneensis TaxID=2293572 RepID=UPI0018F1A729|nr:hypothetical protein [Actinomadura logoneensis]
MGIWRRVRRADKTAAVVVGAVNVPLCGVLFALLIGFGATTREQEDAAQVLGGQILGVWFVGGLLLFSVLAMTRALFVHLATMVFTPGGLVLALVLA